MRLCIRMKQNVYFLCYFHRDSYTNGDLHRSAFYYSITYLCLNLMINYCFKIINMLKINPLCKVLIFSYKLGKKILYFPKKKNSICTIYHKMSVLSENAPALDSYRDGEVSGSVFLSARFDLISRHVSINFSSVRLYRKARNIDWQTDKLQDTNVL